MISLRSALWAMAGILMLGFALGASQLNADILWVDEMHSVSAFGAKDPPWGLDRIISELADKTPEHTPLYFLLGAGWAALAGWSQVGLRYLSLLFGILSLAWIYRIGADTLSRRAGLLAAFLLSSNAFVLIYFHEMRNYTFWLLLCLVHFWQYWRLAKVREVHWLDWLAFAAMASALLYAHAFSLFVLLGLGALHLLRYAKDRRWFGICLAWGAGLLSFLPWLALLIADISAGGDSEALRSKADATAELIPMLANVAVNGADLLWLPILALAAWTIWRGRWRDLLPLALVTAGILLSIFAYHELAPFLSARRLRYFLPALAFALLLVARLLASAPHWRTFSVLFALVWLAGGWQITQQAERWAYAGHHSLLVAHPPLHRFADALQGLASPHETLLGFIQSSFLNNGLHYGFSTTDYYSRRRLGIPGAFILTTLEGDELRQEFASRVGVHPHLLFVYEPSQLPANFAALKTALEREYIPCDIVVDSDEVFAQRYTIHTLPCQREPHEIRYDNGIKIMDAMAEYAAEARSLRILTGWQLADRAQLEQFNVSLQVLNAAGHKVAQAQDRHLHDNILPWYAEEISTADMPPGEYRAMVILYDRLSNKKVRGLDMTTSQASDIFPLLVFTVSV